MALGASQRNVFYLLLKHGGRLTFAGAAIGALVAYLAGRVVSTSLFEVRASDPLILGAAIVVAVGIAVLATIIPTYRTARLDSGQVLRPE